MCLIMYSPEGQLPPFDVWQDASQDNPDGIGIMSERAIVKWTGRKGYVKAWKHVNKLAAAGVPFAVHFRWRTHGAHSVAQCHPHMTEQGSYLMHNGVLRPTSGYATAEKSDTALYAEWFLYGVRDWETMRPLIEDHIGSGNKFVIMDEHKEFHIFNEHAGVRHNGIWYSNDYSFGYDYTEALCEENDGYQAYTPRGVNYGLGYSNEYDYATPRHSAKESAETFMRTSTKALTKPSWRESSAAWEAYYQQQAEDGELDEPFLMSHWEGDDLEDRDDYDNYDDRKCRV
jgi:predicted glutamine amidotransferase